MNRYHTHTEGTMAEPMPMFASIWLTLFYTLRRNFNESRLAVGMPVEAPPNHRDHHGRED